MTVTFTLQQGAAVTIAGLVIPSYGGTPAPVLLSTTPADNAAEVSATSDLIATFDQNMAFGTGTITLQNLFTGSGGWQPVETFSVTTNVGPGAGQVEIVNAQLFIRPTAARVLGREYGIRIDGGALESLSGGVSYEGINTNQAWTWFTVSESGGGGGGGTSMAIAPTYDGLVLNPITPADLPYNMAQHFSSSSPITYAITGQPTGVTINTSTGLISDDGTPFTGSASATVTGSNGTTPNAVASVAFTQ